MTTAADLDLSYNDFPRIPEVLYKLTMLVRLNLSNNEITELSSLIGLFTSLSALLLIRNYFKLQILVVLLYF